MIIGMPKTLEEVPDLTETTLQQMYVGMLNIMQSGQPLEIPVGIATGDLVTLLAMLKKRGNRIVLLEQRIAALQTVKQDEGGLPPLRIDFSPVATSVVTDVKTETSNRVESPSGASEDTHETNQRADESIAALKRGL